MRRTATPAARACARQAAPRADRTRRDRAGRTRSRAAGPCALPQDRRAAARSRRHRANRRRRLRHPGSGRLLAGWPAARVLHAKVTSSRSRAPRRGPPFEVHICKGSTVRLARPLAFPPSARSPESRQPGIEVLFPLSTTTGVGVAFHREYPFGHVS
jgi:hypothetical protein